MCTSFMNEILLNLVYFSLFIYKIVGKYVFTQTKYDTKTLYKIQINK